MGTAGEPEIEGLDDAKDEVQVVLVFIMRRVAVSGNNSSSSTTLHLRARAVARMIANDGSSSMPKCRRFIANARPLRQQRCADLPLRLKMSGFARFVLGWSWSAPGASRASTILRLR